MSWQQTVIVGNLGRDPELRYFQNGNSVCNFNVAVNERRRDRDSGQWNDHTTWYRVAVWGEEAERLNESLYKGQQILVAGTVQASAYTGRNGQPAASLEIRAREVLIVSDGQEQWQQKIIVGTLGDDPDLQSGQGVCSFRVSVKESWTNRQTGEAQERTTWYRVSAWGRLAETCSNYLSKGRQALFIGTVKTRAYLNNSGEAAATLEFTARQMRFINSSNRDGGYQRGNGNQQSSGKMPSDSWQSQERGKMPAGQGAEYASNYPAGPPDTVEDIPF